MKLPLTGPQSHASANRWLAGWLTLILFLSAASHVVAQDRFLFVFDTSAAMKKRLPAVETELKALFASNLSDSLHSGDSVGVWTFGRKVRAGEYPLMTWQPQNGMAAGTNIMTFLRQQEFWGETDFESLQPLLGRVIDHSERLTIVIFCDGDGQIHWTPYDDGINESMEQVAPERKKHRQPVLMILRTQRGKFVGATVTFPPSLPNVPPFPPLPGEEPAAPAPAPAPSAPAPAPPPPSLPPLIIVGNSVGTDPSAVARFAATNHPVKPVPPKTSVTVAISNPESLSLTVTGAVETISPTNPLPTPATNPVVRPALIPPTPPTVIPTTNPVAVLETNPAAAFSSPNTGPTNSVAGVADDGLDRGTKMLLTVGAVLFGTAAVLVIFLAMRRRRPQASLITSLMSEDPRQRK